MGDTLTKKELIDIGGRPLLWHVLRIFSAYGHNHFNLALGHLGEQVRRYFLEYEMMSRDVTLTLAQDQHDTGRPAINFGKRPEHDPWHITMVDTGLTTEKAARIGKLRPYLENCDRFFVAYGEAVSDIDLTALMDFHKAHGKLATVTGIQVDFQYGVIDSTPDGAVTGFQEKPKLPYWINGGFMIFEREILDMISSGDQSEELHLENDILPGLARDNQLMLYQHKGHWQSMKTLKDALELKRAWDESAPWRVW
ncbi:MAG: glucose-1-phosphate cytidylyltransferase [Cellvibrionaceae bacterium]|jgi:glucose-1-phosphate cytidylyltransferase